MKKSSLLLNECKITLPALSVNESICRAMVGAFLSQLNPTIEELADVKCAVSEAFTNAVVHAYKGKEDEIGDVYIALTSDRKRRVKITVRDQGCGIADIALAMTPLFTTDPDGERSGMGFAVMESFCDRVSVWSRAGRGTKVTLLKTLQG
ncbi:MAG: anti-sigma F factor [Clostridia bacterium]|nr:anti-sigma F factor [Clostridia bacterium]MBO7150613.1 anti-sigma F factor [Clostridia bacterium]